MGCAGSKNSPKEQRAVSDSQRRREKRERRRRRATSTRDGDGTSHSKDPNSNSNSGGEDSREERRRRKRARRERRERRRLRRQQREAEGGEDTSSPSGGTSATPSPDTVALSRTPPSAALPVTSNEPFAEEQRVVVPTSAVVVVAGGAAAAATTTQRGVSAAGSSGHGDSVREAGEEGYVGPGPGPAYAGWRSHSCFTEGNGLLFRLVNGRKKQWAFYNDTKEYEMVVAVVFGNESAVRALGDAQLEVMNAVTGQCQVDLVVPPGETKLFMRGEYNGYTTKYRALPVDDDVPEAGAATANGQEVPAAASAA